MMIMMMKNLKTSSNEKIPDNVQAATGTSQSVASKGRPAAAGCFLHIYVLDIVVRVLGR